MEVHLATIVGIVKSVDISSIKVNYLVQDNTGILSCVHWIDAEDHGYKPLKENTFVKIVGHIKSLQDGKKNLMIYSAQYIEDFNEVTSHMLEVVLIPLKSEKMKTVTQGDNYAKMQLQSNYGNDSSMNNSSVGVTGASGDAAKIMQVIRVSYIYQFCCLFGLYISSISIETGGLLTSLSGAWNASITCVLPGGFIFFY
ncbi:hypothetical protein WDU94_008281 [Cyamophila willieti]